MWGAENRWIDHLSENEHAFFLNFFSFFQSFGESVLQSMKSLLHSRKELCNVSAEECLNQEEQDHFIEVCHNIPTYIYFVAVVEGSVS